MRFVFNVFFLFFLACATAYSQHPIMMHYTIDDGLASNQIYTIKQDAKGYIWLATDNGVSRFDGKVFKNFTSNEGLPDNEIVEIMEDVNGRMWLSCYNGTPCYIVGNKIFTPKNDSVLARLGQRPTYCSFVKLVNSFNVIYEDRKGIQFEKNYEYKDFLFSRNAFGLGKSVSIDLKFPYFEKIWLFDGDNKIIDSIENKIDGPSRKIIATTKTSDSSFAIIFKDKTWMNFKVVNKRLFLVDSSKLITTLSYVHLFDNQLWGVSEEMGIIPINNMGMRDKNRDILFADKLVHRFWKDNEGNFWGCTQGNGLYMIPNKNIRVFDKLEGLYETNILKLGSYHNELYLGYNNSQIDKILGDNVFKYHIPIPKSVNGHINTIGANKNYIVAGTHDQLIIIDKTREKATTIKIPTIKSSYLSAFDTLIVGSYGGCYFVKLPAKVFDTIRCGKSMAIFKNNKGELLIGNLNTLLRFKKNKENIWIADSPLYQMNLKTSLSITAIHEYKNKLILGTKQKGLLVIEDNNFQFIDFGEGLRNTNCKSIINDPKGNFWASSFAGIHKISFGKNIHNYSVENFRKSSGLPYEDINDLKIINDTIYAASANGLLKLPINSSETKNSVSPKIYINDIKINDSSILSDTLQHNYLFSANTSTVIFYFSGIAFKSLGKITFKYRLKGINDKWQVTKENLVKYESLPAGNYVFEVFAINVDGIESEKPASVYLTIDTKWWQRWPSLLLFGLIALVIVFWVFKYFFYQQHQKQLKETSFKKQIAEIELKAIKAQINPHFIFNTLNSIQYFIGNQKTEEAELYLGKLGSLLRKTLDFSSKSEVKVLDEINYLENYLQLEKLRFDEHFSYSIQNSLPPNLSEQLKMPPMVLQPHIENALKHSFQGLNKIQKRIDIGFTLTDNQLICTIQDNGIGRKASLEKKKNIPLSYISKGIELSEVKLEMFAQLTGRKVQTETVDLYRNETAVGTKVVITINVHTA